MGLDFDVKMFCLNLKATKPPYECPVPDCRKVYKSYSGILFHMYNYDHDNPENNATPPAKKPGKKTSRKSWHHRSNRRSPTPPEFVRSPPVREPLSYAEAQRIVEIEVDGKTHRLNIYEPLDIIQQDEIDNCDNTEKEERPDRSPEKNRILDTPKARKDSTSHATNKLPEASFRIIEDYVCPSEAPERPANYYRFIEKSTEELDEEVEYDVDEEDYAWLTIINEKRKNENLALVPQEVFEMLMDRFEKEAFFQSQTTGRDPTPSIDEDAVCSICMDGECQNSNVILFCDMCNLAVHQECYGVPYIPEGQWLCRRCLQSPSRAVDCRLCPNKGGAFKQTDDARWAHVVCALWIPEVGFANTVFLEPIDSIGRIPSARWKLTCYICKQRGTGACIQCHKTNCYTAFHVTCAQQAGLFMKIEPIRESGINGACVSVRKTAFCDVHTPADKDYHSMFDDGDDEDDTDKGVSAEEAKAKSRQKMRKARKILAEKRKATPIVSIPMIPPNRLSRIASMISLQKKQQFLTRLQNYWTLKRQSRNGVPLLRRLQSSHMSRNKEQGLELDIRSLFETDESDSGSPSSKNDKQTNALRAQLKYWQRLRQDLEKARLLVELIRKREKLKREHLRVHHMAMEMKLQPFTLLLKQTLDQIEDKDTSNIFSEPVSLKEVPDYLEYIKKPMDLATMRQKVETHQYRTIDEFEADFELIVNNCMTYNAKDTPFYRSAVRMRDQGGAVIRAARRVIEKVGFDPETGLHTKEAPKPSEDRKEVPMFDSVDSILPADGRENIPLEEQLRLLLDKMDMTSSIKHGGKRTKLAKQIRKEIIKVRRQLSFQKGQSGTSDMEDSKSIDTVSEAPSTASSRSQSPDKPLQSATPERHLSPVAKSRFGSSRGKGRARGRPRIRSSKSESENDAAACGASKKSEHSNCGNRGNKATDSSQDSTPSNKSVNSTKEKETPTPSPSGVNRRTAVLFSNKSLKKPLDLSSSGGTNSSGQSRKPGRLSKTKVTTEGKTEEKNHKVGEDGLTGKLTSPSVTTRKRSSSHLDKDSGPQSPPNKQTLVVSSPTFPHTRAGLLDVEMEERCHEDSFRRYTTEKLVHSNSETDSMSDSGSADGLSLDSRTCNSSDEDEGGSASERYSQRDRECPESGKTSNNKSTAGKRPQRVRKKARKHSFSEEEDDDLIPLEPLDLVWAKCPGYPWYPALIINPKMPKTGYLHNGVPIPVPPEEVLALQKKYDEPVYLILFFDTKRTWQWLPREKLEPLGVDSGLDKAKLLDNKKSNVRKAVKLAYQKAILHRCRVTGEPNPLSDGSGSDED